MTNELDKYWVQWFVRKLEDSLQTFGFEIVTKQNRKEEQGVCSMPLVWFEDQMQSRWALHLLRTKRHKPESPEELVIFIKELELFVGLSIDEEE